jgi:hypothetical protein
VAGSGLPSNYTFVAGDTAVQLRQRRDAQDVGSQNVAATDVVTGSLPAQPTALRLARPRRARWCYRATAEHHGWRFTRRDRDGAGRVGNTVTGYVARSTSPAPIPWRPCGRTTPSWQATVACTSSPTA